MGKASLNELDELHNKVAKTLANNLDDPKILSQAITFLKNNNITVEITESEDTKRIFDTVNNIVKSGKDKEESIDELLDEVAYY